MNKYYGYDGIELWDPAMWSERKSMIVPLALWVGRHNTERLARDMHVTKFDGRTDGSPDYKTHAVYYRDVLDEWEAKGLTFTCREMAGVCWIAMIPRDVAEGKRKDPRVLLVLHEGNYKDENWVMNAVEHYRDYNETAAKEGFCVLYVSPRRPDEHGVFIAILQELTAIYHIVPSQVLFDVSSVYELGETLGGIEGFTYIDRDGKPATDPDAEVISIDGIRALDMTDRWQNTSSSFVGNLYSNAYGHPLFVYDEFVHSVCGRKMNDGVKWEWKYKKASDEGFMDEFTRRGLVFEIHDCKGEQWVGIVPKCAIEEPEKKIPLMCIFQEVTYVNPYQTVSAMSNHLEYLDIAAEGECALVFFALESADDNDLLVDIIDDAARLYPIDRERVYLTGHSHNGQFALEFARRNPKVLAAVAPLGLAHGIPAPAYSYEVIKVTDEQIEQAASADMPTVNINGYCENRLAWEDMDVTEYANALDAWQRRLKSCRCAIQTEEEIRAARKNDNYVTRMLGIAGENPRIEVRHGRECYIADFTNVDGRQHFRIISIEKMVHIASPQMPALAWDFCRRFKRDQATGEIIELY